MRVGSSGVRGFPGSEVARVYVGDRRLGQQPPVLCKRRISRRQHAAEFGSIGRRHEFANSKAYLEATDPILMGIAANTFDSRAQIGAFKMGYARLRELAATFTFPTRIAHQYGVSEASSTLAYSGNIWTFWYEQRDLFGRHVNDPSIRESGLFRAGFPGGLAGQQQDAWPTLRRVVLTVRVVP